MAFVTGSDTEANAALISAAPELLEALESLHQALWDSGIKLDVRKHFSLMNADACAAKVIAKAKGGL